VTVSVSSPGNQFTLDRRLRTRPTARSFAVLKLFSLCRRRSSPRRSSGRPRPRRSCLPWEPRWCCWLRRCSTWRGTSPAGWRSAPRRKRARAGNADVAGALAALEPVVCRVAKLEWHWAPLRGETVAEETVRVEREAREELECGRRMRWSLCGAWSCSRLWSACGRSGSVRSCAPVWSRCRVKCVARLVGLVCGVYCL
jgi:hypothetical protein